MEKSTRCVDQLAAELPGFRFHPTEEELLNFYLKTMVLGNKYYCSPIIGFLNIYNFDPWELPGLAKIGEREWYFFVPMERKHGGGSGSGGGRPKRTTEHGFWKATGSDRHVMSTSDPKKLLGLKKTLVFYKGRAPRGIKTDWIMNEYRLPDKCSSPQKQDIIVLCKIYRKATSLKALEERSTAIEEEMIKTVGSYSSLSSPPLDSISFWDKENDQQILLQLVEEKQCDGEESSSSSNSTCPCSSIMLPPPPPLNGHGGKLDFLDLLLQQMPTTSMDMDVDWTQDSFWTIFSPTSSCLDNFTPFLPMC